MVSSCYVVQRKFHRYASNSFCILLFYFLSAHRTRRNSRDQHVQSVKNTLHFASCLSTHEAKNTVAYYGTARNVLVDIIHRHD